MESLKIIVKILKLLWKTKNKLEHIEIKLEVSKYGHKYRKLLVDLKNKFGHRQTNFGFSEIKLQLSKTQFDNIKIHF